MMKLGEADPIYLELYEAIAHFRGRQQLVLRAIAEQGVEVKDLARGTLGWQGKTPQKGDWGETWHFFFHGGGCMLRNKLTDEIIDFNGPDPERIGVFPFRQHLEWRLAHEQGLPLLRAYVAQNRINAVDDLVEHLVVDSIISPDYHLTAVDEPEQAAPV